MRDRKSCLTEAIKVTTERQTNYGSPENSFVRISQLWSAYLGKTVSPRDVAIMMILLKIARCNGSLDKGDNYIDICGYAACAYEIMEGGAKD